MAVFDGLKFVECQCYLTSDRFADDLEAILGRAQRPDVRGVLVCSSSLPDMVEVVKMRQEHPDLVFLCMGLHPLDVTFDAELRSVARQPICEEHAARGIAAIGKIGLDFSRPILRERGRVPRSCGARLADGVLSGAGVLGQGARSACQPPHQECRTRDAGSVGVS